MSRELAHNKIRNYKRNDFRREKENEKPLLRRPVHGRLRKNIKNSNEDLMMDQTINKKERKMKESLIHRSLNSQRISFQSLIKNCNHKGLGIDYLLSAFIFGISGTLISAQIWRRK